MTVLYAVIAIILIGFLVLVHEAGHYTAARLTGVPVIEFAIGFGKRIFSTKKKGIVYSVRMIPFGGFVAFADSGDEHGIENYYKQAVWKRLVTTVSGPLMNFVLAFIIVIIYAMALGIFTTLPIVDSISSSSPAAVAGIQSGDRILRVKGVDVNDDVDLLRKEINETQGKPFDVVVERGGKQVPLVMTAAYDSQQGTYIIGITMKQSELPVKYGFGKAVSFSVQAMISMVKQLLQFLFGLFTQGKGANDVASPIGIVSVMTQTAQQYGLKSFIDIAVFLSVNLGLFNLLPLPALDGSKVIFLLIEWVRGKPVPPEKEGIITAVGFGLFILLFIFLAGRDIARLFGWM